MDSARACNHCLPAQMLVIGLLWLGVTALAHAQQVRSSPSGGVEQHARRMAQGMELFKREVRPLLNERCLVCHGGAQSLGGFDLSSRESLVNSGKNRRIGRLEPAVEADSARAGASHAVSAAEAA